MKRLSPLTATATLLLTTVTHGQHQTETLDEPVVGGIVPYQIELREVSLAPAVIPNIHSTAPPSGTASGFSSVDVPMAYTA